jgi:hypothetical protein
VVADEIRTNGESLRQPVGAGLHRVLDTCILQRLFKLALEP